MAFRQSRKRPNDGSEVNSQSKRGEGNNSSPKGSDIPNRAYDKLVELSAGVESCKQELKLVRDNQRGLGMQLKKLDDNQQKILSLINGLKKATFTIKGSEYEAELKQETANLFCKDLGRCPSTTQISEIIVKVLNSEARNKHKFEVAKTWVLNKLTDFRSEERKRVLGLGNCMKLAKLDTDNLAEVYMKTMGASESDWLIVKYYVRNLALLRKFCRAVGMKAASNNTYKSFREWVALHYKDSKPSDEEWAQIIDEDIDTEFTCDGGDNSQLIDPATLSNTLESPRCWLNDEN